MKVFAVCPGVTETAIFENSNEKVLSPEYHSALENSLGALEAQPYGFCFFFFNLLLILFYLGVHMCLNL